MIPGSYFHHNGHHNSCPCQECTVNNGMSTAHVVNGVGMTNGMSGLHNHCGEKRYVPEPMQNQNEMNEYYNAFSSVNNNSTVNPFGIDHPVYNPSGLYQPSPKRVRFEPAINHAIYGQPSQCQFNSKANLNQNMQFDEDYGRNPIQITLCKNSFGGTTNIGNYYNGTTNTSANRFNDMGEHSGPCNQSHHNCAPSSTTVSDTSHSTWNSMNSTGSTNNYANHNSQFRANMHNNIPVPSVPSLPVNNANTSFHSRQTVQQSSDNEALAMVMPDLDTKPQFTPPETSYQCPVIEQRDSDPVRNNAENNQRKSNIVDADHLQLPCVLNHPLKTEGHNDAHRYVPRVCKITHNHLRYNDNNNNNNNNNNDNNGVSMNNSLVDNNVNVNVNDSDDKINAMNPLSDTGHKIIFNTQQLKLPAKANEMPLSASCHQCKTKKSISILFYCTHKKHCVSNPFKTKRCRKKYCQSCMNKYFPDSDVAKFKQFKDSLFWSFDCPSCQGVCNCKACLRRKRKEENKNKTKY